MSAIMPIEYPMKIILQNKEVLDQPGEVIFLDIDTLYEGYSCNAFKSISKGEVFSPLTRRSRK